MYLKGTGREYLNTFGAVLESKQRDLIILRVARDSAWMHAPHTPKDRRSDSVLHPDRAERERIKKAMRAANAREIYIAHLCALRELSDAPLVLRIGIMERGKQAGSTEDLWLSQDLPLQRGAGRLRKTRLFIVCSKVVTSNVVVSGPTAVIATRSRPDSAVLQVLSDIREADPNARIIGVDVDGFDHDVGELLRARRLPFTLLLPGLLEQRSAPSGPMALIMPAVNPDTKIEVVGHAARDLRGLRAGHNGEWPVTRKAEVEDGNSDRELVTRPVIVKVTEELLLRSPGARPFRARIVRIAYDLRADLVDPGQPLLVCVLGVRDADDAIDLALATVSATDQHPRIAEFLEERDAARVFAGEQRSQHVLDNDRATATVAFAALQLDQFGQTASVP